MNSISTLNSQHITTMKTIIIASCIVLSALSLNANEVRLTAESNTAPTLKDSQTVEATVEQINLTVTEKLESQARSRITQNTEACMKGLEDLRPAHRVPSQFVYAQPAAIRFVEYSR